MFDLANQVSELKRDLYDNRSRNHNKSNLRNNSRYYSRSRSNSDIRSRSLTPQNRPQKFHNLPTIRNFVGTTINGATKLKIVLVFAIINNFRKTKE